MQQYLVSFLIFTPLAAAILILTLPETLSSFYRRITLFANILQLIFLLQLLYFFQPGKAVQFVERASWITLDMGSWGFLTSEYLVGIDGLNLPLVALSIAIMLIATLSSWNISHKLKGYFALLLLLNGAIVGTFVSFDFLLFYLFFEFMLLPMFFLIGIWGGPRREYASIKFFLYTLLGSILILIVMIGLYLSVNDPTTPAGRLTHTFNLNYMAESANFISHSVLDPNVATTFGGISARFWAFLFLFIGFAIKLPMVPLHTWLPDAHVEASTPISVILAALLLKVGAYGLLRIAYPIFPDAAVYFATFVGIMGVISIVYGAFNALGSPDLKRLIAYSSVSHMGFVLLGVASVTTEGVTGAIYEMFSHGIISAMLFLLAGVIYDRTGDRIISHYSGLASKMPAYFTFVLIGFFASMGLPGFSGFIAEIMILLGAFKSATANGLLHQSISIIATVGLVLGAAYYLWAIQRMFFGPFNYSGGGIITIDDLQRREYAVLFPLAFAALFFGILPQPVLDLINPFADAFVNHVIESGNRLLSLP
jgi:NADH-quinone oxidoreductase subunit M